MVLTFKKDTKIIWILLALILVGQYAVGGEMFGLICLGFIFLYFLKSRKIFIPRFPEWTAYFLCIVIMIVLGAIQFTAREVFRDTFYELSNVIFMFLGYYLYCDYSEKKKSIWATTVLGFAIISFVTFIKAIISINGDIDFNYFKQTFGVQIQIISFLTPLLFIKVAILREVTLSKVWDIVILIMWISHVLLAVSRVGISNIVVGFIIGFIACIYSGMITGVSIVRILSWIVGVVALVLVVVTVYPSDTQNTLDEKFQKSFTEVSSENEYKDVEDAQQDWRGYEISMAQKQWKNSSFFEQVIGSGNGKLIKINLVPYSWKETVDVQDGQYGITILHNSYYTLLIKGGLLAVAALLWILFAALRYGFKCVRLKNRILLFEGLIFIQFFFIMGMDAYIVRSLMDKGSVYAVLLLLGWAYGKLEDYNLGNLSEE